MKKRIMGGEDLSEAMQRARRQVHFDTIAQTYDAVRPRYPEALFDTIISACQLDAHTPVLEVGAGTGIATLPLARRGVPLTALEPGDALRDIATEKVRGFSNVCLVSARMEEFIHAGDGFQAIVAGQAYHWVDPERRYALAHQLLRPGGRIGLFWHMQPLDSPFYLLSRPAYTELYGPQTPADVPERLQRWKQEIESSGYFPRCEVFTFSWTRTFTTEHMIRLLQTYSDSAVTKPRQQARFLDHIRHLIDGVGGMVEQKMIAGLFVATGAQLA
ncbi:MAG: methyltransferase domain-containing protein [Myxococcota bacterium]